MDDLSYSYITGTNKLNQVIDNSTADVNSNLEDIFGTTTYEYDEIGNLVKETGQVMKDNLAWNVIRNITWTPSGKVSTVNIVETKPDLSETNTVNIKYQYDASGNRVIKYVKYLDHPLDNKKEYYLRDAQGNIMTVYERKVTPIDGTTDVAVKFRVKEVPLYGSDRIGMLEPSELNPEYDLYSVSVPAGTEDNISFEVNGIQINDGLYNWLIPRNAAINANGEAICSCQLEHWEFANGTIIKNQGTQFMGKTGNNIGVAENKNGVPVLYTVTARNYLGTPEVTLVLDKDGNLMKGSQLIKASSEAKTMIMKSPGAANEYSLIAIDDNNRAWLHKINLSAQGFATGNSIPTGEVYAGIPISTAGEKIGRHLTIIEDEINNINYLYALRFNEPTMQGELGTSELLMYEFKADGQVPAPVVIATIQGFDRTGEGELQISPAGTHLLYYNKLKSIGGFNYKDVDMVALELSADHKSIVPGTIMHINTIGGSHSKASADFIKYQSMSSSNFMFNQHSTIELQGTDKQTWYVDNVTNTTAEQIEELTEKGDVRRSKDLKVYIPGHDNETYANALNTDGSTVSNIQQEPLENVITQAGNILAGSLPGQIFRLRGMGNEDIFTREIGLKKFELKDHLQSSIITVKDFKKPIDSDNNGEFETAEAQIVSYQETYPFGMLMSDRKSTPNMYKFGFGSQEKDDEITGIVGSHYTAEYWEYDTRIGRRWNRDPKPDASISQYATFALNPILNSDPLGDTIKYNKLNSKQLTEFQKTTSSLIYKTSIYKYALAMANGSEIIFDMRYSGHGTGAKGHETKNKYWDYNFLSNNGATLSDEYMHMGQAAFYNDQGTYEDMTTVNYEVESRLAKALEFGVRGEGADMYSLDLVRDIDVEIKEKIKNSQPLSKDENKVVNSAMNKLAERMSYTYDYTIKDKKGNILKSEQDVLKDYYNSDKKFEFVKLLYNLSNKSKK